MSRLSVPEAARALGVHPSRVRQRIEDGSLPAERIGGRWIIDSRDLARLDPERPGGPSRGRPPSAKSAWLGLLAAAADPRVVNDAAWVNASAPERSRSLQRARKILADASPHAAANSLSARAPSDRHSASLLNALAALARSRARRNLFAAAPADLDDMRSDERLILSGVSSPLAQIGAPDVVEAYVAAGDLDDVVADYLLAPVRPGAEPNVVLHVVDDSFAHLARHEALRPALVAADLAEHDSPRAAIRAAEIFADLLAAGSARA